MKAKLIFDLSILDDQIAFKHANNGESLSIAIYQFDQWLRSQYKYEDKEMISAEEVRDKLRVFVQDQGLEWENAIDN